MTAAIVLTMALAGYSVAQNATENSKDYLEQVRRQNEIAAQKLEGDVRIALREAQRLANSDPAKATECLQSILRDLDNDSALRPDRRDQLIRQVKERLRVVERQSQAAVGKRQPAPAPVSSPVQPVRSSGASDIAQSLQAIRALQADGRLDEARQQADDLARRYPDNPAAIAARRNLAAAATLSGIRNDQNEASRRTAALHQDVSRSATPANEEVEFPKDWADKAKKRAGPSQLTAKEKAIVKALNSIINVSFKDTKFEEAIDYISKTLNQPIVLDRSSLEEAQVGYDTLVTLKANGMAVRTVLRQLLGRFGLAYVIKNQTLEVTTETRAKELMTVRSYYIGDLLGSGGIGGFFGIPANPDANQLVITKQVSQLIEMIESSVEPSSWQRNGGSGTIAYNPQTSSLVIRQSAEVHAMIAGGMGP
jgi:hypothetical protein